MTQELSTQRDKHVHVVARVRPILPTDPTDTLAVTCTDNHQRIDVSLKYTIHIIMFISDIFN